NQKQKLIQILNILFHESDENHPLSAEKISEFLAERGVKAESKSIYSDISVLRELDYDILLTRSGDGGFFMGERIFEMAEVRLLMDAVQSAGFITAKKTKELIAKLNLLVSNYQAEELKNQVYVDSRIKYDNEEIYYNIDRIHTAITENKKIDFIYYRRVIPDGSVSAKLSGKAMKVSPYALLWSNDHYYLIGNNEKYDNLIHLRIDRMKKVDILDEASRDFSEVSRYKNYFDVADYSRKAFNMYGGEQKLIELRCGNDMIEEVLDRFGSDAPIRPDGEGYFTIRTNALVSDGLIGWILGFDSVEVVSPLELRKKVGERLKKLCKTYHIEEIK
ncbi:MAG: helix-turn-helix transcriptional regulator, partial [Acutalibacteraceae bacterium]